MNSADFEESMTFRGPKKMRIALEKISADQGRTLSRQIRLFVEKGIARSRYADLLKDEAA